MGGLQRPEDYVTPPVVRISPRHNTTAVASASPTNSLGRRLRILQRSYKWHPLSPQSPGRSTAPREAEEGGRARVRASGRQNWPNISTAEWEKKGGRERVPRLSIRPRRRPSALFPDDCFRVVRRGGIPIIPNRSPICLAATANAICVADAAQPVDELSLSDDFGRRFVSSSGSWRPNHGRAL